MVINNIYKALENLLNGHANAVKIKMPNEKVMEFSMNEVDRIVYMLFYDEHEVNGVFTESNHKTHKIEFDNELMGGNSIKDDINYILETMEDKLNEDFGIIPIGIKRWKKLNCVEY